MKATKWVASLVMGASLAGAMLRMAHLPPSMRQQMGARARALVVEQFDERRVSEAYLDVLRQLPSRSA